MPITINGVPEFLTHEQYLDMFRALGLAPEGTVELRATVEGVHALVLALDENGHPIPDLHPGHSGLYQKHRIFIPVRREPDDRRTTRIRPVEG